MDPDPDSDLDSDPDSDLDSDPDSDLDSDPDSDPTWTEKFRILPDPDPQH